jgi:hypothetical protein
MNRMNATFEVLGTQVDAVSKEVTADLDLDALLGGISESTTKTKRASYPVMPDPDGLAAGLAQTSINLAEAKDQLETNNRLLGELVRPYFFQYHHGKAQTESSIRVEAMDGKAVLVMLKNQCKKIETPSALAPIQNILGGREKDLFYSTFDIKISGEEIPTAALAPLITELKALFERHGASKALSLKRDLKPRPAFFTSRHTLFTVEENITIDSVVPVITSIKVKGVQ